MVLKEFKGLRLIQKRKLYEKTGDTSLHRKEKIKYTIDRPTLWDTEWMDVLFHMTKIFVNEVWSEVNDDSRHRNKILPTPVSDWSLFTLYVIYVGISNIWSYKFLLSKRSGDVLLLRIGVTFRYKRIKHRNGNSCIFFSFLSDSWTAFVHNWCFFSDTRETLTRNPLNDRSFLLFCIGRFHYLHEYLLDYRIPHWHLFVVLV